MKKDFLPIHLTEKKGIHGHGIFATRDILKGKVLFALKGKLIDHPTRTSVQVGKNQHSEDSIGSLINHNCSPTAKVYKRNKTLVSTRHIKKGEEITFDYNESEDKLACPFLCECCNKKIVGRKALR